MNYTKYRQQEQMRSKKSNQMFIGKKRAPTQTLYIKNLKVKYAVPIKFKEILKAPYYITDDWSFIIPPNMLLNSNL